jgi:hypothetical protein
MALSVCRVKGFKLKKMGWHRNGSLTKIHCPFAKLGRICREGGTSATLCLLQTGSALSVREPFERRLIFCKLQTERAMI